MYPGAIKHDGHTLKHMKTMTEVGLSAGVNVCGQHDCVSVGGRGGGGG